MNTYSDNLLKSKTCSDKMICCAKTFYCAQYVSCGDSVLNASRTTSHEEHHNVFVLKDDIPMNVSLFTNEVPS